MSKTSGDKAREYRVKMVQQGLMKAKVGGRPFNQSQPLGKAMAFRGYRVKEVEFATGINYRTLSNYLAGRDEIPTRHATLLAELLQVDLDYLYPANKRGSHKGVIPLQDPQAL